MKSHVYANANRKTYFVREVPYLCSRNADRKNAHIINVCAHPGIRLPSLHPTYPTGGAPIRMVIGVSHSAHPTPPIYGMVFAEFIDQQ